MANNESYSVGCRLFEILRQVRDAHQGDFDAYLILYSLVLAETYETQVRRPINGGESGTRGLNLLSVAEITGIPRETVRRKIVKLVDAGSVARDEGLFRYVGDDGADDIGTRIYRDLPQFHAA